MRPRAEMHSIRISRLDTFEFISFGNRNRKKIKRLLVFNFILLHGLIAVLSSLHRRYLGKDTFMSYRQRWRLVTHTKNKRCTVHLSTDHQRTNGDTLLVRSYACFPSVHCVSHILSFSLIRHRNGQ